MLCNQEAHAIIPVVIPVVSTAAVYLYHGARCIVCIALSLVRLVPGVRESIATGSDGSDARAVEDL